MPSIFLEDSLPDKSGISMINYLDTTQTLFHKDYAFGYIRYRPNLIRNVDDIFMFDQNMLDPNSPSVYNMFTSEPNGDEILSELIHIVYSNDHFIPGDEDHRVLSLPSNFLKSTNEYLLFFYERKSVGIVDNVEVVRSTYMFTGVSKSEIMNSIQELTQGDVIYTVQLCSPLSLHEGDDFIFGNQKLKEKITSSFFNYSLSEGMLS